MKLTAYFYRGLTEFEAILGKITYFAGMNFQGKSSIVAALGALLTGETLPVWIKKKDAKELVNDTSGTSRIELSGENGTMVIRYPDCKSESTGTPVKSSPVAAGLISPADMSSQEKALYFSKLLKTDPTEDQLKKAVSEAKLPPKSFAQLWKNIQVQGWDAACKNAENKRSENKGAWENVTGDNYGSIKAASWRPSGWTAELENKNSDDYANKLKALREELNSAVAFTAVSENEIARLKGFVELEPDNRQIASDFKTEINEYQDKRAVLIAKEPKVIEARDIPCPHCGKPLAVRDGKITTGGKITLAEAKASQKAHEAYLAELQAINDKIGNLYNGLATADAEYKKMQEAKIELKKAESGAGKKTRDASVIQAEIASLENEQLMIETVKKASDIQAKIATGEIIIQALKPEGLRKECLAAGLNKFNEMSKRNCEAAGWLPVVLDENLEISYGSRNYRLLSESEKFRVKIVLQYVSATLDNSMMVVIDGADILDAKGRLGLLNIAMRYDALQTVICMTAKPQEIEIMETKLKPHGIDVYHVENGKIKNTEGVPV